MPKWPQVKPQPYHAHPPLRCEPGCPGFEYCSAPERCRYPLSVSFIAVTEGGARLPASYDFESETWTELGFDPISDVVSWYGTRWIPVSEALPEIEGSVEASRSRRVLCRQSPGDAFRGWVELAWNGEDDLAPRWATWDDAADQRRIVEWMEIPE